MASTAKGSFEEDSVRSPTSPTSPTTENLDSTQPRQYFVTGTSTGLKGKAHPLYQTSNSKYGAQTVESIHKPHKYYGQSGNFTKEFVGGMYRDHSLNCNKTRNIVLPDPTFTTNEHFTNE
ncbi:hypothetical protein AKO1_003216 [Acrasis kona]|uniref:Uncharacterized protein n=1 Tax=Acrasis kona TaxID=1008807 RepID=A0AAW2ZKM0_9EUKA